MFGDSVSVVSYPRSADYIPADNPNLHIHGITQLQVGKDKIVYLSYLQSYSFMNIKGLLKQLYPAH